MYDNTYTNGTSDIVLDASLNIDTSTTAGSNIYTMDQDGQFQFTESYEDQPTMFTPMKIKHISHLDLDGYGATILSEILSTFVPTGYYEIETDNILPNRLNSIMKSIISTIGTVLLLRILQLMKNSLR